MYKETEKWIVLSNFLQVTELVNGKSGVRTGQFASRYQLSNQKESGNSSDFFLWVMLCYFREGAQHYAHSMVLSLTKPVCEGTT